LGIQGNIDKSEAESECEYLPIFTLSGLLKAFPAALLQPPFELHFRQDGFFFRRGRSNQWASQFAQPCRSGPVDGANYLIFRIGHGCSPMGEARAAGLYTFRPCRELWGGLCFSRGGITKSESFI